MHNKERRVLLPEDLKPINSLEEYKAVGGLKGLEKARSMSSEDCIETMKASGLRGRGGAGFPTFIKWQTVYNDPCETKYIVCNGAEGEPGTFKDRYMLSKNPYQLFEGMLIAAHAIGAKQAILGTKTKFTAIVERLNSALAEMEEAGVCEKGYLKIVLGPDEYLFGEEKALLEVIDGRDAMPRNFAPFMLGVGYSPTSNNPTVVNNVESLSHVTNIFRNGVENFRSNGFEDTPGTMILTLCGDVKNPGMYEVSLGLTVREFLYEIGGGPKDGREFKGVLSGISNRIMTPDQFDLQMGFGTLREAGVGLGSGGFIVYDDSRSMVDVAWLCAHFLAKGSCGQCVPCNMGTRVIASHLFNLKEGTGTQDDVDAIINETKRCTSQTRCFLPQQAQIVIPSIMDKFPDEFDPDKIDISKYDHDIKIPKIVGFDEEAGEIQLEENPIEFRSLTFCAPA